MAVQVPSSIDTTGQTDVSTQLTDWAKTLAHGSTVEFPLNAKYRLDKTFNITDKNNMQYRFNDTEFTRDDVPGSGGSMVSIIGGSGLQMSGFTIRGANPRAGVAGDYIQSKEAHHNLFLSGVKEFFIHDFELSQPFGDCVYFDARKVGPAGRPESYDWCAGGWLVNGKVHHSGRQLITLQGARTMVIAGNDIWEARRSTFEMEPHALAYNQCENIHIVKNRIGAGRFAIISNHGSGPCDNIYYEQNLHGRSMLITGVDGGVAGKVPPGRRKGWVIRDNKYLKPGDQAAFPFGPNRPHHGAPSGAVMDFERYDDLVITGNESDVDSNRNPSMVLARLKDCNNYEVHDNAVREVVGGDSSRQWNYVREGKELRVI